MIVFVLSRHVSTCRDRILRFCLDMSRHVHIVFHFGLDMSRHLLLFFFCKQYRLSQLLDASFNRSLVDKELGIFFRIHNNVFKFTLFAVACDRTR